MIKRFAVDIYRGRGASAAALQSLLTKIIVLVLNAGTSLLVARMLKPAGRGEMSALIVWPGFFGALLTFGLPSALTFDVRDKPEYGARIVGTCLLITSVLAVVAGLMGFVALPFWLTNYSPHQVNVARWLLLSSPIPFFMAVGRSALEATGKFSQSNFALWSGPVLALTFLAGLTLCHALTPVTAGLSYLLGNVPGTVGLIVGVWREYRPELKNVVATGKLLLHYGIRSWGVDILGALSGQADQVLIVRFLSPSAMGIYVVAANLARLIGIFQTSTVMVLFPRVAAQRTSVVVSVTSLAARVTTAVTLVSALLIGLAGPPVLGAVYGSAYMRDGTIVFRIILLEAVFGGATQIVAQAFMAAGRPGVVTVVQTAGVGIGLALMPFLILKFGVAGAAAALLISALVRFTLTLFCFRAILDVPPLSLIPKRSDLSFVVEQIRGLGRKPEPVTT